MNNNTMLGGSDTNNPIMDNIDHPTHYQSSTQGVNIEAIDCMRAAFGDKQVSAFCICNAMKYIYRCQYKGGNTDIQKAIWYLNKYLELNPNNEDL